MVEVAVNGWSWWWILDYGGIRSWWWIVIVVAADRGLWLQQDCLKHNMNWGAFEESGDNLLWVHYCRQHSRSVVSTVIAGRLNPGLHLLRLCMPRFTLGNVASSHSPNTCSLKTLNWPLRCVCDCELGPGDMNSNQYHNNFNTHKQTNTKIALI